VKGRTPRAAADAHPAPLLRIHEYNELIAASARSLRQHERIVRAARLPLTGASLALLGLVSRHGPLSVGEVARRVGVAPSTASRQLRPLERHRFIARDASDADRRVAQLRVTPTGERALARARDVMLNDYEVALRGWSAQDRARLGELLAHLRDDLMCAQVDARGWSVAKAPRRARAAQDSSSTSSPGRTRPGVSTLA
jgi:DNA-binding MarR family transcriptional regulator